jgi:hypothetical protein
MGLSIYHDDSVRLRWAWNQPLWPAGDMPPIVLDVSAATTDRPPRALALSPTDYRQPGTGWGNPAGAAWIFRQADVAVEWFHDTVALRYHVTQDALDLSGLTLTLAAPD